MSDYVDECRREWKRLGVPDPVANEMAADLEADLAEAEAEGATAEDVLGSGAFDPRAFAASWAAERGVIEPAPAAAPPPPPRPARRPRGWRTLAALAAFALIAIVGATLAVHRSTSTQLALASPFPGIPGPLLQRIKIARGKNGVLPLVRKRINQQGVIPFFPGPNAKIFAAQTNAGQARSPALGLILLLVGVVGFILTLVHWFRGRANGSNTPRGPSYV